MTTQPQTEFFNVYKALPAGYQAMSSLEAAVKNSSLDRTVFELVKLRSSQINGCAFCIDMHYKDLRAMGESEDRLYMLNAWREATLYSDAERAALAFAEAVTLISVGHVPADVEAAARAQFDDEAYAALLFAVVTINAWNRLAISTHSPSGQYKSQLTPADGGKPKATADVS